MIRSLVRGSALLWVAFVLVHLLLGLQNLYGPGLPLGDVNFVYKFWTEQAIDRNYWVGIDGPWVYPIVAMLPMLVARVFGPDLFANTWLCLVTVLDFVAFGVLTGWGRNRQNRMVGWWWVGFLLLLGPIALGRIDSISVPLAIVGVLLISTRPRAAVVILATATWIKVWPAAIIAAILITMKDRARIAIAVLVTSVLVIGCALVLGSGLNVFSFVTEQAVRGIQVEAPISTPWLWAAAGGPSSTIVYYDRLLLTWQVSGPGVVTASALMTPLLVLVMIAITVLAILVIRRRPPVFRVLPSLALAYVTAFIAVNKVGSPQYITWLAVPVILGLVTHAAGLGRSFRTPAIIVFVIAGLTQLIYPVLYGYLLSLNVLMLVVISARNALLFVLLGWAIVSLLWASRSANNAERNSDTLDEGEKNLVR